MSIPHRPSCPEFGTQGGPIRRPCTCDAEAGMRWWNALTKTERAAWLKRANSAVPADAWKEFKRSAAEPWLELKRASQL